MAHSEAVSFTVGSEQVSCRTKYCGNCPHLDLDGADGIGKNGWCNLFKESLWSGRYGETRATKCREAEQVTK